MSDLISLDGLVLDAETGEVVRAEPGEASTARLAERHLDASQQEKEWKRIKSALEAALLQQLRDPVTEFPNGLVSRKVEGSYPKVDGEMLLDLLAERFESDKEAYAVALETLVMAANGFKKDPIPSESPIPALVDRSTEWKSKKPFVVTSVLRKRAPTMGKSNA